MIIFYITLKVKKQKTNKFGNTLNTYQDYKSATFTYSGEVRIGGHSFPLQTGAHPLINTRWLRSEKWRVLHRSRLTFRKRCKNTLKQYCFNSEERLSTMPVIWKQSVTFFPYSPKCFMFSATVSIWSHMWNLTNILSDPGWKFSKFLCSRHIKNVTKIFCPNSNDEKRQDTQDSALF